MYHNLFIHSSVDGHLGCFHVLVIVNNSAVNIRIRVSFSIMISSGYMSNNGIVGSFKVVDFPGGSDGKESAFSAGDLV